MITFHSPTILPIEAATTMGVSVKESDNAIGKFGTGLKYAIAGVLRLGGTIAMTSQAPGGPVQPTLEADDLTIEPVYDLIHHVPKQEIPYKQLLISPRFHEDGILVLHLLAAHRHLHGGGLLHPKRLGEHTLDCLGAVEETQILVDVLIFMVEQDSTQLAHGLAGFQSRVERLERADMESFAAALIELAQKGAVDVNAL